MLSKTILAIKKKKMKHELELSAKIYNFFPSRWQMAARKQNERNKGREK
jgi:hypothetical protein